MDPLAIAYVLIGVIVFLGSMLIAMNKIDDFKQGSYFDVTNTALLLLLGVICGALWIAIVPIAIIILLLTGTVKTLAWFNDKRFQDWVVMPEFRWAQALYDSRTLENVQARCTFCHDPLVRTPAEMAWEPCNKVECRTLFSMDTESKEVYEQILKDEEKAEAYKKTLDQQKYNPITYPYSTGTNPILPNYGTGFTTSTPYVTWSGGSSTTVPHVPITTTTSSPHSTSNAADIQTLMDIQKMSDSYVNKILKQQVKLKSKKSK